MQSGVEGFGSEVSSCDGEFSALAWPQSHCCAAPLDIAGAPLR